MMASLVFIAFTCVLLAIYWKPCSATEPLCRDLPQCFKITQGLCNKDRERDVCLVYDKDLTDDCNEGTFFDGSSEDDDGEGGICIANEPRTYNPSDDSPLHLTNKVVTQPVRSGTPLCQKSVGPHVSFGIRFDDTLEATGAQDRVITLGSTEGVKCSGYDTVCDVGLSAMDILIKVPVKECPTTEEENDAKCDDCTSELGPCTGKCGHGFKLMKYTCLHTDCPKHGVSEFHSCTGTDCAEDVDGKWCSWQIISPCTKACGGGQMSRHRTCNCPDRSGNGKSCSGSNIDSIPCGTGACPVNPKPAQRKPRKPRKPKRLTPKKRRNLAKRCKRNPKRPRCKKLRG